MLRRSRISVRPNVRPAGRAGPSQEGGPAVSQEAPGVSQDAPGASQPNSGPPSSGTPAGLKEVRATAAGVEEPSVTAAESTTAPGDASDQTGEGPSPPSSASSSSALQRRKRVAVKPRVAPGPPRPSARGPKAPQVKEPPAPDGELPGTSGPPGASSSPPQGLRSPRRRPSGGSRTPRTQPPTPPTAGLSAEGPETPAEKESPAKEAPPRPPERVLPSLPEREALEISERAQTLVSRSAKTAARPAGRTDLSRLLNDAADLQKMAKARKLRALLKEEMHKEKLKKAKTRAREYTLDTGKMTMRDLIYYLPNTNPMTSYLEETACENETVIPPTPPREKSPERAKEPEPRPEPRPEPEDEGEDEGEDEEEDKEEAGDGDDAVMVPRVKVAEDGSLIIDEASLTVEVQRAKGPNPANDRDPIFERGSTTTYSSFRKGCYTKPWSSQETDMFFLAISMVGTDFSMICQLFPHRARSEIKNKFKREERVNTWRIDKAFKERRKLDLEFFSKLLEKILEVQNKRKSTGEKKAARKRTRKPKEKKAEKKLSDVEEEEGEDGELDLEDVEGEKENEDISNEGGTPASSPPKKKRKSRHAVGGESSPEKPADKKDKGKRTNTQEEACVPEDSEAALPDDQPPVDGSEKTDESANTTKAPVIKPALLRGRAPKPLLQLGRKWGKKVPALPGEPKDLASAEPKDGASAEPKDGAAAEEENSGEGVSREQVSASPPRPAKQKRKEDDSTSEGEEDSNVSPPKPTRSGRIPKPTQHLNYPAKVDTQPSTSETAPGSASSVAGSPAPSSTKPTKPKSKSKSKRSVKKANKASEPKRSKLVTLRAATSEYSDAEDSDDEDSGEEEPRAGEEDEEERASSSAPVFVPVGLRSPQPVVPEVEETMEELDISVNVPDMLGLSQDALCPDASCERAQGAAGTLPCEHQLDLLVDVIDFLSSDPMEESDVSYNEAAETLLTIGNLPPQSAPEYMSVRAHTSPRDDALLTIGNLPQSAQEYMSVPAHTSSWDDAPTPEDASAGAPFISGVATCSQDLLEDMENMVAPPVAPPVPHPQISAAPVPETYALIVMETSQTLGILGRDANATDPVPVPVLGGTIEAREAVPSGPEEGAPERNAPPQSEPSLEISQESVPQTRRARLPKVKPMPNLGRATRTAQSRSHPTESALTSPVRTAEESRITPPEVSRVAQPLPIVEESVSPITSSVPASRAAEDLPVVLETCADPGLVPQTVPGSDTSEETAPQNRKSRLSKIKPKPNLQRPTRAAQSKPLSADETSESPARTTEGTGVTPPERVTSDSAAVESLSVVEDSIATTSVLSSDRPTAVTPVEESACQAEGRGRFTKIKPKPNLGRASRALQSSSQSTESTSTHLKPIKTLSSPTSTESTAASVEPQQMTESVAPQPPCSAPASAPAPSLKTKPPSSDSDPLPEPPSSDESAAQVSSRQTTAGAASTSQAESISEQNAPQATRGRFSKIKPKPNLGRATRTTQSEPKPREVTFTHSEPEVLEHTSNAYAETQPTMDGGPHLQQQVAETRVIEDPFTVTDSVHEILSRKTPSAEVTPITSPTRRGRISRVKPKPSLGQATTAACSKPEPTEGSTTRPDHPEPLRPAPKPAENASKPTEQRVPLSSGEAFTSVSGSQRLTEELTSETVTSEPVGAENPWLIEDPFLMVESEDCVLPIAATTPTEEPSSSREKTDVEGPSSEQNVPQTRRSRLPKVKPKPNLRRSSRTTQPIPKPGEDTFPHSEPEVLEDTSNTDSETQPTKHVGPHQEPQIAGNSSKRPIPLHFTSISEASSSTAPTAVPLSLGPSSESDYLQPEVVNPDSVVAETSWLIEDPFMVTDSVPESQSSCVPSADVRETPSAEVTPITPPTRRGRISCVKPKPSPGQATTAACSKPKPTDPFMVTDSVPESQSSCVPSADVTPAEQPGAGEKKSGSAEVRNVMQAGLDSEQTLPLTRRGRVSRVKPKPSLRLATRVVATCSEEAGPLHTAPQPPRDSGPFAAPQSAKDASEHSLPQHSVQPTRQRIPPSSNEAFTSVSESPRLTEELASETSEPIVTESSWLIEDPFLMDGSEDCEMPIAATAPTEEPSSGREKTDVGSALQEEPSSERDVPPTRRGRLPKVKPKPNLRRPTKTTESTEDTTTILEPLATQDGLKPSLTTSAHSILGAQVHSQPVPTTGASRMGHDASREQREPSNQDDSAPAQRDAQPGPSDPGQFSKKVRRARLPKPKPNLSGRSQPACSQPVRDAPHSEPDVVLEESSPPTEERRACYDIQQPAEGGSSTLHTPPVCPLQGAAPPGGVEGLTVSTTHPDAPSDPEESFFILSLTEIPVSEMSGASQPLYCPPADPPLQGQSAPSASTASSDLAVPGGGVAGGEGGVVPDTASPISRTPEEPRRMADAQPSPWTKAIVSSEEDEEEELPCKKRRVQGTLRRAKLQVKPKTVCRRQPSRTTAEDAELSSTLSSTQTSTQSSAQSSTQGHPPQESELPAPPEASPHGTLPSSPLGRPGRRPKGFLSFIVRDPNAVPSGKSQQGKAASQAPQVNTARTGRKRATPTTALPDATPSTSTRTTTQPSTSTRTTTQPSTSTRTTTQPTTSTTQPTTQPSTSTRTTTQPTTRPSTSTRTTTQPTTQPSTSTTQPSTSTRTTTQPTTRPSTSTTQPSTSTTQPTTSTTQSTTQPTTSITQPTRTTTQPSTSTAQPSKSTTQPSKSTTQPSTSTTQPEADVTATSAVCRLHADPEPSTSSFIMEDDGVDSVSVDEEPTNISQFFFSDIITEVDESDG